MVCKMWNQKTKKLEAELPFGLKRIGILLNSGVDFYRTLKIISKEEGEFSRFIKKVIERLDYGLSITEAFRIASKEYNSNELKRAISQLLAAYKSGEKGDKIKRIGEEILSKQEYKIREYSSRSAIYGLLFVVLSVMVPTLMIVLYFIGGLALEWDMSLLELEILLLGVIPLVNIGILLLSRAHSPELLYKKGDKTQFVFLATMILLSLIIIKFGILGLILMVAVAGAVTYYKYKEEKRKEELEEKIPDMLMHISGMDGTSFEKIVKEISNADYGILTKEFKKSYNQSKSNVGVNKILKDLYVRNNSDLFTKTMSLFGYVLESNNFRVFAEMAEDILRYFEIKREKLNSMAMQKYTLILGAVLIPLIISITIGMSNTLSSIAEVNKDSSELFEIVVPLYLVTYSLLSGYHIMQMEEKKSNGMIYTTVMLILGLALYFFMINV